MDRQAEERECQKKKQWGTQKQSCCSQKSIQETENTLEEAKTLDLLKEIKSTDLNMFNERKETVGKEVKENYVVSMRMLVKREIIKRNQILEL